MVNLRDINRFDCKEVAAATGDAYAVLNSVSELIPTAIEFDSGLEKKLEASRSEISKAKHVVGLIRKQKGLQTAGVVAGIRMLESHGKILKSNVVSRRVDKGMTIVL